MHASPPRRHCAPLYYNWQQSQLPSLLSHISWRQTMWTRSRPQLAQQSEWATIRTVYRAPCNVSACMLTYPFPRISHILVAPAVLNLQKMYPQPPACTIRTPSSLVPLHLLVTMPQSASREKHTLEFASCQLNDMDENKEELSFIPSAVSSSAGWREPQFMCDRQCPKKRFQYFAIASAMVKDDGGLHTINICKDCRNWKQGARNESASSNKQWKLPVAEKRSPGKLLTCFGCTRSRA